MQKLWNTNENTALKILWNIADKTFHRKADKIILKMMKSKQNVLNKHKLFFKNHPETKETQKMQQYQMVLPVLTHMLSASLGNSEVDWTQSWVLCCRRPSLSRTRQYPVIPSKLTHFGICVTVQENKIYIRRLQCLADSKELNRTKFPIIKKIKILSKPVVLTLFNH